MVARTPRISGSPNAAFRSAARSRGRAPTRRVVGYSTGINQVLSMRRRIACSCTAGATPGAAKEGDTTATLSPARAFGGCTIFVFTRPFTGPEPDRATPLPAQGAQVARSGASAQSVGPAADRGHQRGEVAGADPGGEIRHARTPADQQPRPAAL